MMPIKTSLTETLNIQLKLMKHLATKNDDRFSI